MTLWPSARAGDGRPEWMAAGGRAAVLSLVVVALAMDVAAAEPFRGEENPFDFGPVPTIPTDKDPYAPEHEVARSEERPEQAFGLLLAALVVLIAVGGRVGGGAVLDAIFILMMKLGPDEAIPLTSITIVGGAVADFLMNLWKKPINSSNSLINWDLMLVMQPMLLMGAAFGASLTTMLPTGLLIVALLVYLGYVGTKTARKAMLVGRDENWRWCSGRETTALLGAPPSTFQDEDSGFQYKLSFPWKKVGGNFGLFGGTILLTSLQGGKYFPSPLGIPPTSFFFLFVSMLPFIFLAVVSHYLMKDVVATYQRQQNPRYILMTNEVQWSPETMRKFPLHLMGAGVVAGFFGVGGAPVCAGLLRGLGLSPAAVSAMTATTILFSSGMASFNFFLWGKLDLHLAALTLPVGFVMTLLGRVCLVKIVRKAKCRALLFFSMAAALLMSVVPLGILEIRAMVGA